MAPRPGQLAGPKNPNWKGGRTVTPDGYVLLKRPDHPDADVRGYVYEHRLVAIENLGRMLVAGEEVHHIDEDKQNNAWSNLEVLPHADHALLHRVRTDLRLPGETNPEVRCACLCGASFPKFDSSGRPRMFVSGHNMKELAHG